jgi:hypothetical protein
MTTTTTTQTVDPARLDTLEQAWRAAKYSRFTETFLSAVREYVTEPSEAVLERMRAELQGRWSNLAPLVQHLATHPEVPLDVLDLRLIDICVALNQTHLVLNMIGRSRSVPEVLARLIEQGVGEQELVETCLKSYSLVDRNWQPTALGRVVLSWPPKYEVEWLRVASIAYGWGPNGSLVALALATNPPRLGLARQLLRQANPYGSSAVQSVQLLQKADPTGFESWAREAALPPYPTGTRQGVLLVAREHAPDLAFELACQILREAPPADETPETARRHAWERAQLRSTALDIAFARAPETYLATVEDVALTDEFWGIGQCAVKLLGKSSYLGAREALRRIVESGGRQARMEALRTVLKSAWPGKIDYALSLLGHRSQLLREEATAWLEGERVDMIPFASPLLDDTHAQTRLAAIAALRRIATPTAHDLLLARLSVEKQARVRWALLDALGMLEGARRQVPHDRIALLEAEAASFRVAGSALPLTWLGIDLSTSTELCWVSGAAVTRQAFAYLLHAQSQTTAPRPADVVRWTAALIQPHGASDFALLLFRQWITRGARLDEAWCLPLIATLGDERLVPLFRERIEKWGSQKTDKALLTTATRLAQALIYMDCVAAREVVAALITRRKQPGHAKVRARVSAAVAASKRIANNW